MIHKEIFSINTFQVDRNNCVTPSVLFGMMQESASRYCYDNRISIEFLSEKNLTWMLARQYVKFSRFPLWRESVTVETWPRNKTGIRALRDFLVTDEKGEEVAKSVTNWMLIDTTRRRPCKIDDTIEHLTAVEKSVMKDDFKIRVEKIEGEKINTSFHVRHSDFDVNKHVNNICYIRWALDTVPSDFQKNNSLSEISVEFLEEIATESPLDSSAFMNGKNIYHELVNGETGRIVFRAQTAWQAQ